MSVTEKLFETTPLTQYAKEWKSNGKKVLSVYCCHTPEEILYAADILPYRLRGTGCADDGAAETYMSSYACSFARSILQKFLDGENDFSDGLIGADSCLMMQRVFDNIKVISQNDNFMYHQFVTPKISTPRAVEHYALEINELKEAAEKLSGVKVTDEKLRSTVALYNKTRSLIKELYDLRKQDQPVVSGTETLQIILAGMSMPKEQFNEMLEAFLEEAKKRAPIEDVKARLMIVGSSLDDPEYIKIFEDKGGLVVTDHNCYGTRYLWEPIELSEKDTVETIAEAYLKRPVCPRMFDLQMRRELSDYIVNMAKEFKADGVVFVKMRNCDMWGGENYFLEDRLKEAGLPMLELEREEIVANAGQVAVRAEAFVEMIEGGK